MVEGSVYFFWTDARIPRWSQRSQEHKKAQLLQEEIVSRILKQSATEGNGGRRTLKSTVTLYGTEVVIKDYGRSQSQRYFFGTEIGVSIMVQEM
jgi:hypothetical protein